VDEALLEVRDLVVTYPAAAGRVVHAVNGVSFTVEPGRICGIVGESGSGKSTLVRALIGILGRGGQVTGGTSTLAGHGDLLALDQRELRAIRGAEIGYIGQNPVGSLHPIMTVEDHFREMVRAHGRYSGAGALRRTALQALADVQIPESERVLHSHAHELSGGMAQRVVIALALLLHPRLLIADEPTTGLDLTIQRQILDLILDRARSEQLTMLLVTHDLGAIAQYCEQVVVMYAGKVMESGAVDRVFSKPAHPYTEALMGSVFEGGAEPRPLAGRLPSLVDYPTGCPFQPRCPRAFDKCAKPPPEVAIATGGTAACFLAEATHAAG